ncbi:MAG TPA: D-aminoacyl-tRNA deacylase [Phycisphaerales bacterium]|nr:D-aminoacyl-tRNA deacylase [Phycisphaerales bacterium]
MIAVVQRVSEASVTVASEGYHAALPGDMGGLCVLLGVEQGDTAADATWMAGKLARLRIFRDEDDKMNRSVLDIGGGILLVSQFTLAGDCSKGNRPSFVNAAPPEEGRSLYDEVARRLREDHAVPVATGVFGAMMQVGLINDGPVTLIVRTPPH